MNADQESLTVNEVGSKAKSKQEIYRILSTEGRIYLPPSHECNYNYLRDIISGAKNHLKGNDVKCITVPSFKGLAIEDIFLFAEPICRLSTFLPDIKGKIKFVNRNWMCNVVNTLCEDEFKKFIKKAYCSREECLIKKKDLRVQALPEFIHLFKKSNSVSHEIGRSHYLLRKSLKRKANEIEEDEKEELKRQITEYRKAKVELESEVIYLTQQVEDYKKDDETSKKNNDILAQLYDQGIIDSSGNLVSK